MKVKKQEYDSIEEINTNSTNYDIPDGWSICTIPDLISSAGVFTDGDWIESKDQDLNGEVRLIQLSDIGDGVFRNKTERYLTIQKALELNCTFLQDNDILIARMPDPLGRACIFPGEPEKAVTAVDVCIVRPGNKDIHINWLLAFINSPQFRSSMKMHERGTTRKRISRANLGVLPLLLPPQSEQMRIAFKAHQLIHELDTVSSHLRKSSDTISEFRQSVLTAACSGQLTSEWRECAATDQEEPIQQIKIARAARAKVNQKIASRLTNVRNDEFSIIREGEFEEEGFPDIPDTWSWIPCAELCQPERALTYGVIKLGPDDKDGIPTLRSSDVRWLNIEDDHIKRISPQISREYKRTILEGGEVLVTVRGTLGGVAAVPNNMKGFNVSREVAVLPLEKVLNPSYIAYSLAVKWSQNWLSGVTKGVAYTGVNIEDLKRVPLAIPPIAEQNEIVRRVEGLFALADGIERNVKAAIARAEALPQAILARAFRGELVPTEAELAAREGRDYEPASVLLERIKEARQASGPSKRGRRSTTMQKQTPLSQTVYRRPLDEVLREQSSGISPERLFSLAGYDDDSVDKFYEDLRALVQDGKVREYRPNRKDVILEAIRP